MKSFHVHLVAADSRDLGTKFEEACAELSSISRLHLEMDGSFVWVGPDWQLDGMIYDCDDRLRYVELKGSCPLEKWRLLQAILVRSPALGRIICLPEGGLYDLQTFESFTWFPVAH